MFAVDGYRYGGKDFDRLEVVADVAAQIPSLERIVVVPYLSASPELSDLAERPKVADADDLGTARGARRRAPSSASSASPSTTRSGSSTPPARPACRRRSSRATAASCSSS